jgi:hypothetical protein
VASQRFDQCSFSQGQLDPRVQKRIDWENYYKAAKTLRNMIVIPQGGAQVRWGTKHVTYSSITTTNLDDAEISELVYNNDAIYLLLWEALSLKIYLENHLVATLVTQYKSEDMANLRFTQVQTRIVIDSGNYKPQQLKRSSDAAVNITAFSSVNNTLTANTGYAAGLVLPVIFATGTSLPVTSPQIFIRREYFIRTGSTNTFQVFSTAADAEAQTNAYTISSAGVAATVAVQNTWSLADISFKFYPAYDFDGGYFGSSFTFTPSATSGNVTITASAAIFTAAMVGGLYTGNSGIVRLTGFTDSTHMTGFTIQDFANTNASRDCFYS